MIKTYIHNIQKIEKRDEEVNNFVLKNGSFAIQTNITEDIIITTIFYKV